MAFAQWLNSATEQNILLPTEQQWQRAAQGDDERVYPWGNEWDESRCNLGGDDLTPVTQYEGKGDSPFGVVDMIGNVFEWCRNEYHLSPHAERRAARSGAYFNPPGDIRCNYRNYADPTHQLSTFGFRLASQ
jgi:formylglycine-generating enzyme required for sulfatase activity